jgi:ABC-2 type transport system ATP-binding protein
MSDRVNILEIDRLVKTYETGHRALDGLTLHVRAGSLFGCIGLNGAGKTTMIRTIAGLLACDGGTIRFDGQRIPRSDNSYKKDMGYVLDEPLYFEWMSAMEYLTFVGEMYGLSRQVVEERSQELLVFFDLASKVDDPIESFSTGMKKKVSLAAAILHRPRLVVLDEPLDGIDPLAARAIKDTLSLMVSHGVTVMITSHVLETMERVCTDIAIIHQGKALLQSPTGEIHAKARRLVDAAGAESLERLFVELVSDKAKRHPLSYV